MTTIHLFFPFRKGGRKIHIFQSRKPSDPLQKEAYLRDTIDDDNGSRR